MTRTLPDGLYEHLVTSDLDTALATVDSLRRRSFDDLDDVDAPAPLARHLGREVERVLAALPQESRAEAGRELISAMLDHLVTLTGDRIHEPSAILGQKVSPPARTPQGQTPGGAI